MSKRLFVKSLATAFICVGAFFLAGCGKKDGFRVIQVQEALGNVSVQHPLENDPRDVVEGMHLYTEDTVTVGDSSRLTLLLDSAKYVAAEAGTTFKVSATGNSNKGRVRINVLDGKALFDIDEKLNGDSTFEVSTPNAVISVRGTEFSVEYNAESDYTSVAVTEGKVHVSYMSGEEEMDILPGYRYLFYENDFELVEVFNPYGDFDFSTFDWTNFDSVIAYYGSKIENNHDAIREANYELVANMKNFVASCSFMKGRVYSGYKYMYMDYDLDGNCEVILCLTYGDGCNDMIDMGITHYDPKTKKIALLAVIPSYDDFTGSGLDSVLIYDYTDTTGLVLLDGVYDMLDQFLDLNLDDLGDLFF